MISECPQVLTGSTVIMQVGVASFYTKGDQPPRQREGRGPRPKQQVLGKSEVGRSTRSWTVSRIPGRGLHSTPFLILFLPPRSEEERPTWHMAQGLLLRNGIRPPVKMPQVRNYFGEIGTARLEASFVNSLRSLERLTNQLKGAIITLK